MLIDKNNEFADAVSVANVAATINIGSTIDLSTAGIDVGNGTPLWLVVSVDTAIVTGGSTGTLQFALVSDSTAVPATDSTRSVHALSPAFVTDDDPTIPAGRQLFCFALPLCNDYVSRSVAGVDVTTGPGAPYERYLGVQAIIATTTITAGKVNAFLTHDPLGWKAYAAGI